MKEQSAWDRLDDTSRRQNLMLKTIGESQRSLGRSPTPRFTSGACSPSHIAEAQAAVGVSLTYVRTLDCGEGAETTSFAEAPMLYPADVKLGLRRHKEQLNRRRMVLATAKHFLISTRTVKTQSSCSRITFVNSSLAPQRDKLVVTAVFLDNSCVPGGCFFQSSLGDLCCDASLIFRLQPPWSNNECLSRLCASRTCWRLLTLYPTDGTYGKGTLRGQRKQTASLLALT